MTHDTLKAMGCPHEEACHEDVRKRKEKIDQYRLRYREENLSERDRLLQTCPYPALWLFFLIAGIPLLAIGSLFLLQDGMIRNYNAIIVIVPIICFLFAYIDPCITLRSAMRIAYPYSSVDRVHAPPPIDNTVQCHPISN